MNFKKNIQFSLLVPVQTRLREFNFRKRNDEYYDGDVSDERNNRYYFNLKKETGRWIIVNTDVPEWLTDVEMLISTAIDEKELTLQP